MGQLLGPDPDRGLPYFGTDYLFLHMVFSKEAQRRQRRRELDARRSKFRVRLGSWPENWNKLKDQRGFSLHSELAYFLLDSYSSKRCSRCLGTEVTGDGKNVIAVTVAALHQLVLLIHSHAQCCPLTPSLQTGTEDEDPKTSSAPEAAVCLKITCDSGHKFTWCPSHTEPEEAANNEYKQVSEPARSGRKRIRQQDRGAQGGQINPAKQNQAPLRSRRKRKVESVITECDEKNKSDSADEEASQPEQDASSQEGSDAGFVHLSPKIRLQTNEASQISRKRKRKPAPKLILPCGFDGCSKIFSTRQYLNHHIKYQHVHQKTFSCSHSSCGKSFNFKKHLKEHEKLHSDQRDYICEFCARAFRTSSNLSIHRRIHTGEKPLQCEVCGYTCRQKASLNWHMRKHVADHSCQFECDICNCRFEKRESLTAHKSKSHPDHVNSNLSVEPTVSELSSA